MMELTDMSGRTLGAPGEAQKLGLVVPVGGDEVGEGGLANGQRAGLVEDDHVECAMPSSVAASLIRMPWRAPIPVPTATAVGVASPSASGQAMTMAVIANVSAVKKLLSDATVQMGT